MSELVKRFEGCQLEAYQDSAGVWTIGWGHTPARPDQCITQEEADELLARDLAEAARALEGVRVRLTPAMEDALTSFAFNVGRGAFAASTLLRELNERNYFAVPRELCRWYHAGGKPSLGLARRRAAEAVRFLEDGLP